MKNHIVKAPKSSTGIILVCLLLVFVVDTGHAAFHVWTGTINGYWSNTNNWQNGSAPAVFETPPVQIDFPSGTGRLHTTNDIGSSLFRGLHGVVADSILIGDNYTFSGKGQGTNLWFSGNPSSFYGVNLQNIYCPLPNLNVTFDGSLNLYFQNTNTITNAISSALHIQSTLFGASGLTYQGSGDLLFDGSQNYYTYVGSLTGTFNAQAGTVLLARWDIYNNISVPAVNGSFVIGTTNTANPAVVFEYNPNGNGGGQFGNNNWSLVPVTLLPSGILENYGVDEGGISSLTMTGGAIYLGSTSFQFCPPNPFDPCFTVTNYGYITATNITVYESPSGTPSVIKNNEQGVIGYLSDGSTVSPDYEGVFILPYIQYDTNQPGVLSEASNAVINVVSGTLNIFAPLFGLYSSKNLPTVMKTGAGTLGLYGTNEYYANTIIQQGLVVAGGDQPFGSGFGGDWYSLPANTVVLSNGTELVVASPLNCPVPLVLNGYGTNGSSGALLIQSNGAAFINVKLGSDAAVQVASPAATVTFGIDQSQYFMNSGGWYSYSPLAGAANLHKTGPGRLQLMGHYQTNAISGTTYVDEGILALLGVTNFVGTNIALINGPLVIGTNGGDGFSSSVQVQLMSSQPITSAYPLVINPGGELNILSNKTQTVNSLLLDSGYVMNGNLILNGDITAKQDGFFEPQISFCNVSLAGTNRNINAVNGAVFYLNSTVVDGGNNAGVIKTGTGELDFAATNKCAGSTVVTAGSVGVLVSGVFPASGGGVIVSNNANLILYNSINIGAASLALNGSGISGLGVVQSYGSNIWSGPITLAANVLVGVITNAAYPASQLELSGLVTGAGSLNKFGAGNLLLDGALPNTYTGGTVLQQGPMSLSKTSGPAIPGALTIGLGLDGPNGDAVHAVLNNQLSSSDFVNISSSGLLDVGGNISTSIGSLTGIGTLQLGVGGLTCGLDNTSTTFSGSITGSASGSLLKSGTGVFTLTGGSPFVGIVQVNGGQLFVNGSLASAAISFVNGATLGGIGTVGAFGFTSGTLAPGINSPGILNSGNLLLNSGDTFLASVNGTTLGSGYSQLNVTGTVSLGNSKLQLTMPVIGITNSQLTLINNDGADAVTGTFINLPEGATFTLSNGAKFKISYKGGTGNDVVLTQTSLPAQPKFTGITGPGSSAHLAGTGSTNTTYTVWANTNLTTANWITLGAATASGSGQIQFTDTNSASFKQRFYRFSWP